MIRTLFLLSLLANAFILPTVYAQGSYTYFGGSTVIAPSGLNIRQSPDLKTKKIGAIPYGF